MSEEREHERIEAEIDRTELSSDPFAAAMRATRMPMLITDPNQPDNPIVFVNDSFCRLTGYARPEILGCNCRFLQGPETDQSHVARIRNAIAQRSPIEIELLNYRKDGATFWNRLLVSPVFDDKGKLAYFFASQHDASAERLAAAALRDKSLEFEMLAENVSQLAWMAKPDGHIYWYNRRWYDYTGTTLEAMLGWGWREVHLPDQVERIIAEVGARWAAGQAWEGVYHLRSASGEYRPFLTRVEPIRDAAGQLVQWFGTNTDISAQVEAEQRLRELNDTLEQRVAQALAERAKAEEQLRQAQKMDAMGQLTGGMAHDFNNLLTPIMGVLDRLMARGVGSERERRLIDGALQSAERAKTLVQRLLAFARRQPLQPVAVDVGALVEGMAGLIRSTLGASIELRTDVAGNLPPARADANQLEMALLNLAVNARDAMQGGGRLTIAASRESVNGQNGRSEPHPGLTQGHYVRLTVADTGSGMDEATRVRAVEPFFSTKGIGKGTGLGLSMVHGLAAQLGGGLVIDSKPGHGTTVALWLPLSAEPAGMAEADRDSRPSVSLRGRVLLVDDEDLVRLSTADMLTGLGFEVLEASSAEDALKLLRAGVAVDLLITDQLMPGLSGSDLVREAGALRPGLPALIVSGYADVEGVAPGLPRLTKPFRSAELAGRLAALMPADV